MPGLELVLRYGAHPEQIADVRLPGREAPHAVVLLLHGGFWREEYDRHHTDPMALDLVARGHAVVSVEYRRLGGAGGWPTTFDDVAAAVDLLPGLLVSAAPTVSRSPLVTLGHSAGGHLALWAAGRHGLPPGSRWHRRAEPGLRRTLALAPVADVAYAHELRLDDGVVAELLGPEDTGWPGRLAEVDPTGLPPAGAVVIVHGNEDRHVPLEVSRRYLRSMAGVGGTAHLDVLPGVEHFALIEPTSAAWPAVLDALERVRTAR